MGREIWKFPVTIGLWTEKIPSSAKFLSVQMQDLSPQMWWLIDPSAPTELFKFIIVGTGQPLPDDTDEWTYLGSFIDGFFVWHLFQVKP